MGTFVAIEAEAPTEEIAQQSIAAAFAAISLVERLMHPFRRGSDLAALADSAPEVPLAVHPWTYQVLEFSRHLNQSSLGIFDPCVGTSPARITDLELQAAHRIVAHRPMRIDLGGIAKGYAVDRAIDALRDAGCTAGLVNAGGDVAVFGPRIRKILCGEPHCLRFEVDLRDGALASSDASCASRPAEHHGYYHGANRSLSVSGRVTVLAGRAVVADGLTKCLLAGDHALNRTLLRKFGATAYAL
jgi:thiamine biosynthesis lipoprotein